MFCRYATATRNPILSSSDDLPVEVHVHVATPHDFPVPDGLMMAIKDIADVAAKTIGLHTAGIGFSAWPSDGEWVGEWSMHLYKYAIFTDNGYGPDAITLYYTGGEVEEYFYDVVYKMLKLARELRKALQQEEVLIKVVVDGVPYYASFSESDTPERLAEELVSMVRIGV